MLVGLKNFLNIGRDFGINLIFVCYLDVQCEELCEEIKEKNSILIYENNSYQTTRPMVREELDVATNILNVLVRENLASTMAIR